MRPVIIFLCLLRNLVSLIGDENEGRCETVDRYPRSIYQQCLQEVLPHASAADREECLNDDDDDDESNSAAMIMESISQEDLAVLQLFGLRNISGENWDDGSALRTLRTERL